MNFRVLFLIITACTMSCNTSKTVFNPQTSEKDIITFGSGGGFTGQVTKYYLTKDGNIYTQNGDSTDKVGKISKTVSGQIFANYIALQLDKMSLNEPGNRYYFVALTTKGIKKEITWGKAPIENANLDTYYKVLMNTVKSFKSPM
jgi:hypothetical protein